MITVTIRYACAGCHRVKVVDAGRIERKFVSITGRSYGLGNYYTTAVDFEKHAPDGWLAFDPITQVTYCEDCWDSIVNDGE